MYMARGLRCQYNDRVMNPVLKFIWEYKLWAFLISAVGLWAGIPAVVNTWDFCRHRWWDYPVFAIVDRPRTRTINLSWPDVSSNHAGSLAIFYPRNSGTNRARGKICFTLPKTT